MSRIFGSQQDRRAQRRSGFAVLAALAVAFGAAEAAAQQVPQIDLETVEEPLPQVAPPPGFFPPGFQPAGPLGQFGGGGFAPNPFAPPGAVPVQGAGGLEGVGALLGEGAPKELWKQYDEDSRRYKQELAAKLLERQKKLVKDLEAERDKLVEQRQFEQAADIQIAIRRLRQSVMPTHPDPGYLTGYRGQDGKSFFFRVVGATDGTVWGTDLYTDDSRLATAAVHAGVLAVGQAGVVKVTMVKPDGAFRGSTRNGVTTLDYGDWPSAYQVERP